MSFPITNKSFVQKMMAIWLTKRSDTSRWFYHVNYRIKKTEESEKGETQKQEQLWYFVLDLFNSDCGIFCTLLVLPVATWIEKNGRDKS